MAGHAPILHFKIWRRIIHLKIEFYVQLQEHQAPHKRHIKGNHFYMGAYFSIKLS